MRASENSEIIDVKNDDRAETKIKDKIFLKNE